MRTIRKYENASQVAARDALSERIARDRAPGVVRTTYHTEFLADSGTLYVFIVEDWERLASGEPVMQCAVTIGPRGGVHPLPSNKFKL